MQKIKISSIKSKHVFHTSETFLLIVGHRHWNFGIQVHDWGIRFILIWWHVCIRF